MANSVAMISDLTSVYTTGPSAVTTANAIAPNGPIEDYIGMTQISIVELTDLKAKLSLIIANTDATTDAANLALLQRVFNNLV